MTTQEMINELHRVARKHEKDIVGVGETDISRMCEDVAKRLEELDKQIQEQSKVGDWIPCSERFPSKEEFKEAYCRNKYGAEFIVMIEGANRPTTLYLTSDGLWVDDCRNVHEVLAWRPLPESYTKGE